MYWKTVSSTILLVLILAAGVPAVAVKTVTVATVVEGLYQNYENQIASMYVFGLSVAAVKATDDDVSFVVTSTWLMNMAISSYFTSIVSAGVDMALFGPGGTNLMSELMMVLPANNDFVVFAPYSQLINTQSVDTSKYISSIMWATPSEGTEAAALLNLFASNPQFPMKQLLVTLTNPFHQPVQ